MAKWKKKPVEIEAFCWMVDEVPWWWIEAKGITVDVQSGSAFIPTLEGTHEARSGDYIIKGVKGELYPCKPDIFIMTYEKIDEISLHNDKFDPELINKISPNICECCGNTIR